MGPSDNDSVSLHVMDWNKLPPNQWWQTQADQVCSYKNGWRIWLSNVFFTRLWIWNGWQICYPAFHVCAFIVQRLKTCCSLFCTSLKSTQCPLALSSLCYSAGRSASNETVLILYVLNFFRGNITIYLHFMSLLHIDVTHVLKILPRVRPGPTYST